MELINIISGLGLGAGTGDGPGEGPGELLQLLSVVGNFNKYFGSFSSYHLISNLENITHT